MDTWFSDWNYSAEKSRQCSQFLDSDTLKTFNDACTRHERNFVKVDDRNREVLNALAQDAIRLIPLDMSPLVQDIRTESILLPALSKTGLESKWQALKTRAGPAPSRDYTATDAMHTLLLAAAFVATNDGLATELLPQLLNERLTYDLLRFMLIAHFTHPFLDISCIKKIHVIA